MEIFRTKIKGDRVYIAKAKHSNDEMIYRVKDGHALWGYTRNDLITEKEYLAKKKLDKK